MEADVHSLSFVCGNVREAEGKAGEYLRVDAQSQQSTLFIPLAGPLKENIPFLSIPIDDT